MRKTFTLLGAAAALSGCALLNTLSNEVSTFSQWPSGRAPGAYVFDRLPSQQAQPERQQALEAAAGRALETAGFRPAAAGQAAEYTVQLGARVNANERSIDDDPFWWHGGVFYGRRPYYRGAYFGSGFGFSYRTPSYEREVALLIRDRASSTPLYEARAINDGGSPTIDALLPAMFEAALKDFPQGGPNPRTVRTEISK